MNPCESMYGQRHWCPGGLAGHGRNLLKFQVGYKHRGRRYPAPAVQFPTSTNEFVLWTQREIEDHLRRAAVELLRQLEKRLLRPGLSVSRTPDRHIERFLFNLLLNGEAAEKTLPIAVGNVERGAIAIGFQSRAGGN